MPASTQYESRATLRPRSWRQGPNGILATWLSQRRNIDGEAVSVDPMRPENVDGEIDLPPPIIVLRRQSQRTLAQIATQPIETTIHRVAAKECGIMVVGEVLVFKTQGKKRNVMNEHLASIPISSFWGTQNERQQIWWGFPINEFLAKMTNLAPRGRTIPVDLPSKGDERLHLAGQTCCQHANNQTQYRS